MSYARLLTATGRLLSASSDFDLNPHIKGTPRSTPARRNRVN